MNIEALRDLCRALPAVTEDIKWGHDLCFSVAGKMFALLPWMDHSQFPSK
jgi:predicted DNA-binding protein (MmcQ/YjbR family)